MNSHVDDKRGSEVRRVSVFLAVCLCHVLLIWAFAGRAPAVGTSVAISPIEVSIISATRQLTKTLQTSGSRPRAPALPSVHMVRQLPLPSIHIDVPADTPGVVPDSGAANAVSAATGLAGSPGQGTGHARTPLTLSRVHLSTTIHGAAPMASRGWSRCRYAWIQTTESSG
jgi:hypothetical protein